MNRVDKVLNLGSDNSRFNNNVLPSNLVENKVTSEQDNMMLMNILQMSEVGDIVGSVNRVAWWMSDLPPRLRHLGWRIAWDILLTANTLCARAIRVHPHCPLCLDCYKLYRLCFGQRFMVYSTWY